MFSAGNPTLNKSQIFKVYNGKNFDVKLTLVNIRAKCIVKY